MKSIAAILFFCITGSWLYGQDSVKKVAVPDPVNKVIIAEASCGMCKFGMKGNDCALAVRFNGKSYYVDGTNIDDHGDAHAADGFCNAIRMARIQGTLVNGRFKATYFKLASKRTSSKTSVKKTTD
jgi:hypothetical protein